MKKKVRYYNLIYFLILIILINDSLAVHSPPKMDQCPAPCDPNDKRGEDIAFIKSIFRRGVKQLAETLYGWVSIFEKDLIRGNTLREGLLRVEDLLEISINLLQKGKMIDRLFEERDKLLEKYNYIKFNIRGKQGISIVIEKIESVFSSACAEEYHTQDDILVAYEEILHFMKNNLKCDVEWSKEFGDEHLAQMTIEQANQIIIDARYD